jgi:RimJ/RimL family protein N-acetyltransferase
MSGLYIFKNFAELSESESAEVLRGRNDPEVRRWMTTDRVIGEEEHRSFVASLRHSPSAVYIRIERAGFFLGVYSLNDIQAGSALGGFWTTEHARRRMLALNVVYQGMDHMFRRFGVDRIYGYQRVDNHSALRLNGLLGLQPCCEDPGEEIQLRKIQITREQWQRRTVSDSRLQKLLRRTEELNGE